MLLLSERDPDPRRLPEPYETDYMIVQINFLAVNFFASSLYEVNYLEQKKMGIVKSLHKCVAVMGSDRLLSL